MAMCLCLAGLIIAATSKDIGIFVFGTVTAEVGKGGLSLLNLILVSDFTDLKWRSFCTWCLQGTSTVCYLLTPWLIRRVEEWETDATQHWLVILQSPSPENKKISLI